MSDQIDTRDLPMQRRDTAEGLDLVDRGATIAPASWNEEQRTVDVVWTTGARVQRYDFWNDRRYEEELVVSEKSVDMARFNGGMPLLNSHNSRDLSAQIGVVTRAWLEDGRGMATVKLSEREDVAGIVADIKAGIIRNISVGYSVRKYEVVDPAQRKDGGKYHLYRAVEWAPAELSFVPIPADADAQVRAGETSHACEFIVRAAPEINHTPEQSMSDNTAGVSPDVAAEAARQAQDLERARAAEITALCAKHRMPELAADAIAKGTTVDALRSVILDKLAEKDEQSGGHVNVRITQDEVDTRNRGIELALMHRVDPSVKLDDSAREFRGMSLVELGREMLEGVGVKTRGKTRVEIAGLMLSPLARAGMHTVSDFPSLMSNVANKRMRAGYEAHMGTFKSWMRRAPNAPDFKSIQVTVMSAAPRLEAVNEHGEFKYGSFTDGKETYQLATAGKIVALTRQAIVNDDLRGFDRIVNLFGQEAGRFENRTAYAVVTGNAALSDGVALFSAVSGARTQANVITGAGSALQLSALSDARKQLRKMVGMASETLNLTPTYLIVPTDLETTAYQLTSANYVPTAQSGINEFAAGGRTSLQVIVEPVLDAASATQWYLAADAGQIDTIEYCYLDGFEGPVIEQDVGFEIDGVQIKCRLDFAAKAIDYRGMIRAAGA